MRVCDCDSMYPCMSRCEGMCEECKVTSVFLLTQWPRLIHNEGAPHSRRVLKWHHSDMQSMDAAKELNQTNTFSSIHSSPLFTPPGLSFVPSTHHFLLMLCPFDSFTYPAHLTLPPAPPPLFGSSNCPTPLTPTPARIPCPPPQLVPFHPTCNCYSHSP